MHLRLELITAGSCTHPAWVVTGRPSLAILRFPSLVGVIRHPVRGLILFDAGYSPRFFSETRRFPEALYRHLTPVTCGEEDTVAAQLRRAGKDPDDVALVILSHFHADHVGGLLDFPRARLLYRRAALERDFRRRSAWRHLAAGVLPGLLPADLEGRSLFVEDQPLVPLPGSYAPFTEGYDLLGDGNLLGVDLAGHARGQLGVLLPRTQGPEVFLIADACWQRRTVSHLEFPHPVVRLITADMRRYRQRIRDLHQLALARPDLLLVPSHCAESLAFAREQLGAAREQLGHGAA
ncbi:MAG TPA: MBL fold metallo-hydrolase [Thermoanaerobaculia bacterium]|nr:MBL fold metallo-hydrolase [Thermoanaerobaculia bacterium]